MLWFCIVFFFSFLVFRLTYCACIRLPTALLHYLLTALLHNLLALTSLKLRFYVVLIILTLALTWRTYLCIIIEACYFYLLTCRYNALQNTYLLLFTPKLTMDQGCIHFYLTVHTLAAPTLRLH